jgi:outer membrane protein W
LKKSRLAKMFVVAVLAGVPAWAQGARTEISASAGWTFSDGVSGATVFAGDGNAYNSIDPKDSFSWNATLGFFANENWEIEFLFSQQKSTLQVGGSRTVDIGDMSVDNYHGIFSYNFGASDSRVRPYLFGGAGATHYGSVSFTGVGGQQRSTEGNTKFSTTWGAGVKIYPGHTAGLRLQARWTPTYIKSDAVGWWCDPYWGCYTVANAQYSNQFEFTGGLTLRF